MNKSFYLTIAIIIVINLISCSPKNINSGQENSSQKDSVKIDRNIKGNWLYLISIRGNTTMDWNFLRDLDAINFSTPRSLTIYNKTIDLNNLENKQEDVYTNYGYIVHHDTLLLKYSYGSMQGKYLPEFYLYKFKGDTLLLSCFAPDRDHPEGELIAISKWLRK